MNGVTAPLTETSAGEVTHDEATKDEDAHPAVARHSHFSVLVATSLTREHVPPSPPTVTAAGVMDVWGAALAATRLHWRAVTAVPLLGGVGISP